jgi:integrase
LTWDRYTRHDRDHFLRVLGKGNKERRLRVPQWAARELNAWRRACPERERIFRWGETTVYRRVRKAAERAGLGHVAPHDLRRTFFALCTKSGMGLKDISRAMGHAYITTTVIYDVRPDEEALAGLSKLDQLEEA